MPGYYQLFGKIIKTELDLYEVVSVPKADAYDIEVTCEKPPQVIWDKIQQGFFAGNEDSILWFEVPNKFIFFYEGLHSIKYWKLHAQVSDTIIKDCLMSSGIAMNLIQNQILPIHGSAQSYQGNAFIISGGSGSGKSTVASGLLEHGLDFVSDDISAVSIDGNHCIIQPGPPWQKVCSNEITSMDKMNQYRLVDANRMKYGKRLNYGFITAVLPVHAMFILCWDSSDVIQINEVQGIDKLHYLTHNLFRGEVYHMLGITPVLMQLFANVAKNLKIFTVTRPIKGNTKEEIRLMIYNKVIEICNSLEGK